MNNGEMDLSDAQILRLKAEEKLKSKKKKSEQVIEADLKKLLHELQVHQIELEMQNEELREAYERAEIALEKFTMLYDFAPLGYFSLEEDGSIVELNFTGAEILGDKRFSLVNCNFKIFVAESSKSEFNMFLDRVFASNTKESCEVTLGYDGKPSCNVYMEGVIAGHDRICLLSVINVSALKR